MKTKSRRRLLLSSVAMLLVAVLALGTATFAWFTSSDTAKATAQVKATAPTGLEICAVQAGAGTPGANAAWGDNLDLSAFLGDPLEPVSFDASATSTNFPIFQTTMNSAGVVSAITSTTANTNSGTKIKNLVAIDIYGKVSGSEKKEVKFNLALPTRLSSGNAMRCAVYSVSGTTLNNKCLYNLGKDNTVTSSPDGWRTSYPIKSSGSGLSINTSSNNYVIPNSGYSIYVSSAGNYAYGVGYYTSDVSLATNVSNDPVLLGRFLFWVDGQDPWCQNANKGGLITSGTGNFTLNFKLA